MLCVGSGVDTGVVARSAAVLALAARSSRANLTGDAEFAAGAAICNIGREVDTHAAAVGVASLAGADTRITRLTRSAGIAARPAIAQIGG